MKLEIHDTLTRRKQSLVPIEPGHVRMYVCGVTTYDLTHIGHGRTFVAFDVMQRWLRAAGYKVTYVRNITDIDDKIIKRAAEKGETPSALTARFIAAMREHFAALGMAQPDHEPRATEYVPPMLDIIGLLQEKGHAYQADGGDVNFSVRSFPGYGKLSHRSLDDLRAGERVGIDPTKRDPLDFALWKSAKPGEPQWPSCWGPGRPGWHIECSAMASELLGPHFDIHGGGPDLIFPHHENEIAQSEGAFGAPFASIWIHTGSLRMGEDQMSKSLGNVLTIRDAVARHDPDVVRFYLLRPHYRSQVQFAEEQLVEARAALARLYTALRDTEADDGQLDWDEPHAQRFAAAMNDDFNTPVAVATLFELATEVNRSKSTALARQLRALGGVLGILQNDPLQFLHGDGAAIDTGRIESLIAERAAAKSARNYAEADRIRAGLLAEGVVLEDGPGGTTWRRQ
jgi:cysteinyl-tRNA synthetase